MFAAKNIHEMALQLIQKETTSDALLRPDPQTGPNFKIKWKIEKILKNKSLSGRSFSNIIGTCRIEYYKSEKQVWNPKTKQNQADWFLAMEGEAIFKYSRIPRFRIEWEHQVDEIIKSYVPCLNNFAFVQWIKKTPVLIEENGTAAAKIPQKKSQLSRSIEWDVAHIDYVKGKSLAQYIAKVNSKTKLIFILQQVMAILYGAQKFVQFTHFDLHSANVMIKKPTYENDSVWYLYEWEENRSMLIPSNGIDIKIIDLEFAHVSGVERTGMKGRMDMIEVGQIPFNFDPEIDPIHLLINSFFLYSNMWKDDEKGKMTYESLKRFVERYCQRETTRDGCYAKKYDQIKMEIFQYIAMSTEFDFNKRELIEFGTEYYYTIIEYLLHSVKWNPKQPIQVPDEVLKTVPFPRTMDSKEVLDWKKSNENKRDNASVMQKLYNYFSSPKLDITVERKKAIEKDSAIKFDSTWTLKEENDKKLLDSRNWCYRIFWKICSHLLTALPKDQNTRDYAKCFVILKTLIDLVSSYDEDTSKVEAIAHTLQLGKRNWIVWYYQYHFYQSLCGEYFFELYRIMGRKNFGTEEEYNTESNFERYQQLSKSSDSKQKIFLDPLVAFDILESLGAQKPGITNETVFYVYKPELQEPMQISMQLVPEEDIRMLNKANNSTIISYLKTHCVHF